MRPFRQVGNPTAQEATMTETKNKKTEPAPAAAPDDPRPESDQNRIDLNDPTLSDAEAVAKNLKSQG
jgi:hypothetical protein